MQARLLLRPGLAGALLAVAPAAACASPGPIAAPMPPAITPPTDHPFPGTIALAVDATDTAHQIFTTQETIPARPGPLTLLYPEWETGSHAPTGTLAELAGLRITANARPLAWRRDPINLHAFHITVPPGATGIAITLQFLAPVPEALLRPNLMKLPWERTLLYPAGWYARNIPIAATAILPPGLRAFTALEEASATPQSGTLTYRPVTLERLLDSPVYAARFWQQTELAPPGAAPVHLDLVADTPSSIALSPDTLARLRALVTQTAKLLGPAPFRHYDAIVSLSDSFANGGGIEHLEEGENNLPANYLTDQPHQLMNADLIAHEYVHAWNGRFRQPAGLWSPNFNLPVQTDLLWVYEGQTEFWGRVLAARAGLRTYPQTLDRLALDAALVANRPARAWKSLADSSNDAIYMPGHTVAWRSWQRREDYYPEGVLLWLDIDSQLRQRTQGRQGLDGFARRFFAAAAPTLVPSTYTFGDICRTLNQIAPADWASILRTHLQTTSTAEALSGLARAGWQLTGSPNASETFRQAETDDGVINLDSVLGLQIRPNGTIKSVLWNSPAFNAGLAPGDKLTTINAQPYSPATLQAALKSPPITLATPTRTLTTQATRTTPALQRLPNTADYLTKLLAPTN